MTNQPKIDPALAANLEELTLLAREIGAVGAWVIRESTSAIAVFGFSEAPTTCLNLTPDGIPAGVLVVLRFPASDGGAAGVEMG